MKQIEDGLGIIISAMWIVGAYLITTNLISIGSIILIYAGVCTLILFIGGVETK